MRDRLNLSATIAAKSFRGLVYSPASSCLATSQLEGEVSIHDNLTPYLRDGSVYLATLLDAIGGGETTAEKASDAR